MHPLLASRTRFILYLASWIPLGAMLGLVLSMSAPINWRETAAITAPLSLILAFVCLSPWYSSRFLPLGLTPVWKLLTNHLLAAVVLSSAVLAMARMLATAFAGIFPRPGNVPSLDQRFRSAVPVLAGMSILLDLLAIALHYVVLAVQSRREAELLARETEVKALKA